jgi:TetR/AcrR family transcriptional repressor of nem operon
MKKSKMETAETRKRIVEVAIRAFRDHGIRATGIAEIMSAAGLTHGGFYRHFASKDQLVAEACAVSMEMVIHSAEAAAEEGQEAFLRHIETFLSGGEFREGCLGGSPLVATGSELARADSETRRAASQGFSELIDVMIRKGGFADTATAKGEAIFILSATMGAMNLSRIIDDPTLSELVLNETRKRLAGLRAKARQGALA